MGGLPNGPAAWTSVFWECSLYVVTGVSACAGAGIYLALIRSVRRLAESFLRRSGSYARWHEEKGTVDYANALASLPSAADFWNTNLPVVLMSHVVYGSVGIEISPEIR